MILYSDCIVKLLACALFFSFLSYFCIMLVLCLFAHLHFLSFLPFPFVLTLPHFFTWQEKTRSYQVPNSFLPSSSYPISSVARQSLINPRSVGLLAMDQKISLCPKLEWKYKCLFEEETFWLSLTSVGLIWGRMADVSRITQSRCRLSGRHTLWHVSWNKVVTYV